MKLQFSWAPGTVGCSILVKMACPPSPLLPSAVNCPLPAEGLDGCSWCQTIQNVMLVVAEDPSISTWLRPATSGTHGPRLEDSSKMGWSPPDALPPAWLQRSEEWVDPQDPCPDPRPGPRCFAPLEDLEFCWRWWSGWRVDSLSREESSFPWKDCYAGLLESLEDLLAKPSRDQTSDLLEDAGLSTSKWSVSPPWSACSSLSFRTVWSNSSGLGPMRFCPWKGAVFALERKLGKSRI